jgi:hypothetical protein
MIETIAPTASALEEPRSGVEIVVGEAVIFVATMFRRPAL